MTFKKAASEAEPPCSTFAANQPTCHLCEEVPPLANQLQKCYGNQGSSHWPWSLPPFHRLKRQPYSSLPWSRSWPTVLSITRCLFSVQPANALAAMCRAGGHGWSILWGSSAVNRSLYSRAEGLFNPTVQTSQTGQKSLCSWWQEPLNLCKALAKSFTAVQEQKRCIS